MTATGAATGVKADSRWVDRAAFPVSAASAAVFRIAFGAIALLGTLRYAANGWIDELLVDPPLHFTYPGLGWVRPWPGGWMYLHFAVMGLATLGIALGWRYRWSVATYAVLFTWVELIDRTLYLNHYYWVSLTAALMVFLPLHRMWSLDARAGRAGGGRTAGAGGGQTIQASVVWLLRIQLAMVYVFAGMAKVGVDWLVHAQPLATWLPARASLPVIGPLLTLPGVALTMSWAGALFDLTIVGWLLWRRSRPWAYAVVVAFHLLTWLLFASIGLFPWLMIGGTLVFFEADWPLRFRHGRGETVTPAGEPRSGIPPVAVAAVAAYLALMAVVPLRHLATPGDVLWSGDGYLFSWRVMLTEKAGSVQFRVTDPATGALTVEPMPAARPRQAVVAATDPAMIRQAATWIAAVHGGGVEVRADAFLSFNGRPHARLIDPDVDLAASLLPEGWVLPPPG